jgi:hypothetical protein
VFLPLFASTPTSAASTFAASTACQFPDMFTDTTQLSEDVAIRYQVG